MQGDVPHLLDSPDRDSSPPQKHPPTRRWRATHQPVGPTDQPEAPSNGTSGRTPSRVPGIPYSRKRTTTREVGLAWQTLIGLSGLPADIWHVSSTSDDASEEDWSLSRNCQAG